MNFVYGDSYGGVQGAEQAADSGDRQYQLGLIAAQQAAQRLAMQGFSMDLENRKAMEDVAMGRAKFGEGQRQFDQTRAEAHQAHLADIDFKNAELDQGDTRLQQEAAKLDWEREKWEKQDNQVRDQYDTYGQGLSNTFNDSLSKAAEADNDYKSQQDRYLSLKGQADQLQKLGKIRLGRDKKSYDGVVTGIRGADDESKELAVKLNSDLAEANVEVNRSKLVADEARKTVNHRISLAESQGFRQDVAKGEFFHPYTKKHYSYINPGAQAGNTAAPNSPVLPTYNRETGVFDTGPQTLPGQPSSHTPYQEPQTPDGDPSSHQMAPPDEEAGQPQGVSLLNAAMAMSRLAPPPVSPNAGTPLDLMNFVRTPMGGTIGPAPDQLARMAGSQLFYPDPFSAQNSINTWNARGDQPTKAAALQLLTLMQSPEFRAMVNARQQQFE